MSKKNPITVSSWTLGDQCKFEDRVIADVYKRQYLMSSRDITFAVDNPIKVFRIKKSDDLELSKGSGGIPHCEAYRCSSCKKILIDYANR